MSVKTICNWLSVILWFIFIEKIAECACPTGFDSFGEECYKFTETQSVNYTEAGSVCSQDGAHLVYIPDCNKFLNLIHYLGDKYPSTTTSGFWIGATDEDEEGYWVWGNGYPVHMGVPFWGTSENWDPEPNGGQLENCAQLSISNQYFFHDEDCQATGIALCQIDSVQRPSENEAVDSSIMIESGMEVNNYQSATCPDGFKYIGKSCFFFGNNVATKVAKDALSYCQSINAVLPILDDCIEYQELVKEIETNYELASEESYWVGATDQSREGVWIWDDFTYLDMRSTFWGLTENGTLEPSGSHAENCATLYRDDRYYFHDDNCNNMNRVLCQASATWT